MVCTPTTWRRQDIADAGLRLPIITTEAMTMDSDAILSRRGLRRALPMAEAVGTKKDAQNSKTADMSSIM